MAAENRPPPVVADSGSEESGSKWYLDPVVALHKRRWNLGLIRECAAAQTPRVVLKTDLFEEANGQDQVLFDLALGQSVSAGFDRDVTACSRAARRAPDAQPPFFVSDARQLALANESVDLIISTSTLDHMDARADLEAALGELYRVLRPGGRLALTLDNPWNPMYHALRLVCSFPGAPFHLGYTASRNGLEKILRGLGFEIAACRPLIHNPRVLSTLGFMAVRRLLGDRANASTGKLLDAFDRLDRLPTRWVTGCFTGICAAKPRV